MTKRGLSVFGQTPFPENSYVRKLTLLRSFDWANACASAALNAGIGVDDVFAIPGGDSRNGTFALTGTARDTFVRNNICHKRTPPFQVIIIVPHSPKKSTKNRRKEGRG